MPLPVQLAEAVRHQPALSTPVGVLELSTSQLFINMVQGPCTTETTLDLLEQWWTSRKSQHPGVTTIMIDLDNSPQVESRRKLFLQGLIELSDRHRIAIELV